MRSIVRHINPSRRDRYFSRARSDKLVLLVCVAFDFSTSRRFSYFCLIWSHLSAGACWHFVSMIAFRKYNSAVANPVSRGDWIWLVASISMHQSSNSICYSVAPCNNLISRNGKHQLWKLPNPICFRIALRWPSNKIDPRILLSSGER